MPFEDPRAFGNRDHYRRGIPWFLMRRESDDSLWMAPPDNVNLTELQIGAGRWID